MTTRTDIMECSEYLFVPLSDGIWALQTFHRGRQIRHGSVFPLSATAIDPQIRVPTQRIVMTFEDIRTRFHILMVYYRRYCTSSISVCNIVGIQTSYTLLHAQSKHSYKCTCHRISSSVCDESSSRSRQDEQGNQSVMLLLQPPQATTR